MVKPLSTDLRDRVVASVLRDGLSRRVTAARFGVGVSTVIDWLKRFTETGSVQPGKIGGYRPKKLVGEYRDWLLQRCQKQDFTLQGLVKELADRGLTVDYRSVWEFVHAENLTYKKGVDRVRAKPSGCCASQSTMAGVSDPD